MRIAELKTKIFGAEALRAMKEIYPYDVLSSLTGLSPQILSRYVTGHFLPNLERARTFIRIFREHVLKEAVLKNVEVRNNVVVNIRLLSNTRLLSQIAKAVASEFTGKEVKIVLTKETDGIPFATLVANEIKANLVIAKQSKEVGVEEFIEVRQIYPSGIYSYVYVPKDLISRGDRVLIVDDIIRSGSTIRALIEICHSVRADIVGVCAIVAIGNGVDRLTEEYGIPVNVIARLR